MPAQCKGSDTGSNKTDSLTIYLAVSRGKTSLALNTYTTRFKLTVIKPRGDGSPGDTTLEQFLVILDQCKQCRIPAVAVAPDTNSGAVHERVAL